MEDTDRDRAYVADRHKCALWYAWGQIDAGIGAELDPFAFAQAHRSDALAYRRDEIGFLPSIMGAWHEWLRAHGVDHTRAGAAVTS